MTVKIIIGKNFGDEGKGLAADKFAAEAESEGISCVCVRHNGGAQAGHTVDLPDRRFVFSQLSSASFRHIPTYWADSFLPDLYKLPDEAEGFRAQNGHLPDIYASGKCRCTCILDVLINMMLETLRGDSRHGSCGMGINEAVERSERYPLLLGDVVGMSAEALYGRLAEIRREYIPERLKELGIAPGSAGEYGEMLDSPDVLRNAAEGMCRGAEYAAVRDAGFLKGFGRIISEGAQGLLLDEYNTDFAPNLTTSRTGLYEPARICRELFGADGEMPDIEAVYVTRSYVTRHGAGRLPYEGMLAPAAYGITDRTNVPNPWQGSLRFAPHGTPEEFTAPVKRDLAETALSCRVSLFVTHLNVTGGNIVTADGNIPVREFCRLPGIAGTFGRVYLSDSPFSENTVILSE